MFIQLYHLLNAIMELIHPFSMMIAGGRKAGKTEFTKTLLRTREIMINPFPERIVWCYAKHQEELYEELMTINSNIEYVHGCLLYTSPSPRDQRGSRMPSSA